jgi:hypothetical protein
VGGHRRGEENEQDDDDRARREANVAHMHGNADEEKPDAEGACLRDGVHPRVEVRQPDEANGSHRHKPCTDQHQQGGDDLRHDSV